jgi:hypothetical protein
MMYFAVRWNHSSLSYPELMYTELDHDRWEQRKVEVYKDGTWGYADSSSEVGGRLGLEPWPELSSITPPEFEVNGVSAAWFEEKWAQRDLMPRHH